MKLVYNRHLQRQRLPHIWSGDDHKTLFLRGPVTQKVFNARQLFVESTFLTGWQRGACGIGFISEPGHEGWNTRVPRWVAGPHV